MEKIYGIKALPGELHYPVATLGVFDGVHRGHQKIIDRVRQHAMEKKGESVVITFNRHPKTVIENRIPSFITSLEHRLTLFDQMGVDYAVVLNFNRELAHMSAEDFIHEILVDWLGVKCVILGFDCRFGKNRKGDITLVRKLSDKYGFEVYECPPVFHNNQIISSTAIRQAILEGALERAEEMLGRPVSILGTVVRRSGRGRTLGYPTANVHPHHEVRPPRGVYGTKIHWADKEYLALTNIGLRPTFTKEPLVSEDGDLEIEVHILDFQDSLYGKDIEVQFLFKIRDEISFKTETELKTQIERDKEIFLKKVLTDNLPKDNGNTLNIG
ncbi:MAG: bifunctional riboflavin kinase/FAD synthetase [wastewater metagenome]|nr:bifunctional riboflavin kinase/FAD synthetase [Candidatus Loosdrechtia aerotolerans]